LKITLGEKEYDLEKSLPVTLGDIRRLKSEYGVQLADLSSMDLDVVAKVLLMLCRKVDKDITEAMVDDLPIEKVGEVASFLSRAVVPVDRPTLG